MRAGIALGSNLGNRMSTLQQARRHLEKLPGTQPPVLASALYETEPVDCEPDALKFLNAVMEIGCDGEPGQLMRGLREIEAALGRPPQHDRNVSRTLDLDLLYFGDRLISTSELELPHPRMQTRRFVLEPLAEIRPDLVLPGQRVSVANLLAQLPDGSPLLRVASEW